MLRPGTYLRTEGGTVWLTQAEIAELLHTTPQHITQYVKAVYALGELTSEATCKSYLQVQSEGARQVRRTVKACNLDHILAVGYRVRPPRGTQFRQWPLVHLKEYPRRRVSARRTSANILKHLELCRSDAA